jgi:hypothetical protein
LRTVFLPPLLTRIDLVTDRLSVWDFPFVIGAMVELTEMEFREYLHGLQQEEQPRTGGDLPVFLDIEMVSGQHAFLWMEIVAGLPTDQLRRIYSPLRERRLIFGLREGGIGILNLANLVRLSVHPEPPAADILTASDRYEIGGRRFSLAGNRSQQRSGNGKPHTAHSRQNNHFVRKLHEEKWRKALRTTKQVIYEHTP